MDSMRRKPTTLQPGSYSAGTMRPEDLIPCFVSVCQDLRLTRTERQQVNQIIRESALDDFWERDADDACTELFDILNNHCPDYCYFGASEGDGADYGCWISWDGLRDAERDGEVCRLISGSEFPQDSVNSPYALAVTDHGNATLYRRAGRRWIEVWSVV